VYICRDKHEVFSVNIIYSETNISSTSLSQTFIFPTEINTRYKIDFKYVFKKAEKTHAKIKILDLLFFFLNLIIFKYEILVLKYTENTFS